MKAPSGDLLWQHRFNSRLTNCKPRLVESGRFFIYRYGIRGKGIPDMNSRSRKVLITISKLFLAIILTAAVSLAGFRSYHQARLRAERAAIRHIAGQYVEVGGQRMNVYTAGSGVRTLVFLAGYGTPSPVFDFKPLYSRLTDHCRIAVIEKFGYGYSDEYAGERAVDIVVDEAREALSRLDITGPFILAAHSAGGIEALWWAEHYPDEVEGIIGLDSSIPAQYTAYRVPQDPDAWEAQDMDEAVSAMAVYDFFMYDIGLIRLLMNPDKMLPALSSNVLTETEKEQYRAIAYDMYCRGSGAAFQRETIMTSRQLADLREYCSSPVPDVPTLFFVSDGRVMERVMEPADWIRIHTEYISGLTNGSIVYLDCGHFVHAERPAETASGIISFIESLDLQGG